MVSPFLGGKNDKEFKKNEMILPYIYDHEGGVEDLGLESIFLWPVRLDEMNYYRFRVPGFTHDHLRDRGHIMNLAYAHSTGVKSDGINANFLGFTLGLTSQPMGEAVPIPVEAEGTSGRTDFSFAAHHVNLFTKGNVYYPFYDLDIYREQTINPSGGSPYGGDADAGYSYDATGVLLIRSILVKAGVAAPIDRGARGSQYGNNATFRFQVVEEGLPVSAPEGGSREDVLARLGFSPSYLAAKKPGKDPLESAWPTERIDPDDTHLLLVTFYEGRIAGEWRIQNALDVPLVGNVGLPETVSWGADKLGIAGDLGSVPRFQFRRVMCRILAPADGVVTPASGFEGVKDKLGEVRDGVVSALSGLVDRIIGWLEDMPLRVMETATRVLADGVCGGAGFMDTLGDNVPGGAVGGSGGGSGTDVGLSGVEADSWLGEQRRRQIAAEVSGTTGDCSAVGRAVDDPARQGVPAVGFRAWRVNFAGGVASMLNGGAEWKDDYYGVRWLPRAGRNYTGVNTGDVKLVPYALGVGDEDWADGTVGSAVSLPDSVDTDQGVGAARFDFDFDHIDLLYNRPSGSSVDGYLQSHSGVIDWEKQDSEDLLRRRSAGRFDGYILYVRPDPKAGWHYTETAGGKTLKGHQADLDRSLKRDAVLSSPGSELRFVLPLYYLQFGNSQFTGKVTVRRVPGFDIGPVLGHDAGTGNKCADAHIGVLASRAHQIGGSLGRPHRYIDAQCETQSEPFDCELQDSYRWDIGTNQKVAFVGASD